MNTTPLFLIPLASLGLLAGAPTPPVDADADLQATLARIDAAVEFPADPAPAKISGAGVTTGSLQPSSGLDSGARGLTPDGDWQRLFPRYAKRP